MTLHSLPVETLIAHANRGDQSAWNAIVDRYAALVWSVCRGFRLSDGDAADVSQTVWLRTVEKLATIRVPAALPGWLVTTTRNECLRIVSSSRRSAGPLDDVLLNRSEDPNGVEIDDELLAAERRAVVREAFAQLPEHCQRLLALLVSSEHKAYAEISRQLQIPVGSIGPTRSRCLDKLRNCPAMLSWLATADERGAEGHE